LFATHAQFLEIFIFLPSRFFLLIFNLNLLSAQLNVGPGVGGDVEGESVFMVGLPVGPKGAAEGLGDDAGDGGLVDIEVGKFDTVGAAIGGSVGAFVGVVVGGSLGQVSQAMGHSSLTNEPLTS
jgi:hypothetical protein